MSTWCRARAPHSAARLPGASRTVVRTRHSTVSRGDGAGPAPADVTTGADAAASAWPSDTAPSPSPPAGTPLPVGGGAWLCLRAHQVWNAAVTARATAEAINKYGPPGWCPIRFATASATATAVNSAASSVTSRRQWWEWRAVFLDVTSAASAASVMSVLPVLSVMDSL